ncbi:MAG: AraC family transcriptional regulator [Eubacterium sp.]|nr:AraC family transcriptional regulator [Eubacterium sp.]
MIESLNGMHETVNYKTNTKLRLYDNVQSEDYPNHWHTPVEIIMPLENTYSVAIGSHMITLQPSDIILICPGVIHSLQAPADGRRMIFQAEITMFSAISDFEAVISLMSPALKISKEQSPDLHRQVSALLTEIASLYDSGHFLLESAIYSRLLQIFFLAGNSFAGSFEHVGKGAAAHKEHAEKFILICQYIKEHCTESISLDEIAKIAGFSKYHFTRLFKQFTATTFYRYLNQKRIEYAQKLLADPEIPITDVALRCGYTSLSAFLRMFKLMNQCTPTEYRQMFLSYPSS